MNPRSRVYAIANQKGGVGKTTTSVNLAASFAVSERPTLLVDLDPQGNATSGLGINEPDPHVYSALIGEHAMKDLVRPTELDHLHVVPAGPDLVGAELELVDAPARERRLERALAEVRNDYDLILVDCPPSLGLLTLNALTAADRVIVPLQAEYYALEGLARLLETIEAVRAGLNPGLALEGILMTMTDARNTLSRQVADEARAHFGDRVFDTEIPRNVRLSEAPSHGQPALLYDIRSKGAIAYLRLAEEILRRQAAEASGVPAARSGPPAAPTAPAPSSDAVPAAAAPPAAGAAPTSDAAAAPWPRSYTEWSHPEPGAGAAGAPHSSGPPDSGEGDDHGDAT